MAGRSRRSRSHISMIQESWEFSLSWHRSEITEIMAGHLRSALLIPIAAGVEAAIIWALRDWIICGNWPGQGELAMIGAATLVVVAVIMVALEAHHWRTATWRSWQTTPDWHGGAYVAPPARRHGPMLMCVHAVPPHSRPRLTDPHTSLPMGRRARSHPRTEALRARCGAVL